MECALSLSFLKDRRPPQSAVPPPRQGVEEGAATDQVGRRAAGAQSRRTSSQAFALRARCMEALEQWSHTTAAAQLPLLPKAIGGSCSETASPCAFVLPPSLPVNPPRCTSRMGLAVFPTHRRQINRGTAAAAAVKRRRCQHCCPPGSIPDPSQPLLPINRPASSRSHLAVDT